MALVQSHDDFSNESVISTLSLPWPGSHSPPLGKRCLWLRLHAWSSVVPFLRRDKRMQTSCRPGSHLLYHLRFSNKRACLHFQDLAEIQTRTVSVSREEGELISHNFIRGACKHLMFIVEGPSCIPCPAWWHETPPFGCQSPSLCRPKVQTPSYHSRRRLPAERSGHISHLLTFHQTGRSKGTKDVCLDFMMLCIFLNFVSFLLD